MKTSEASRTPVVTAREAASLSEVAKSMRENHVGCVVVVGASGNPVGIVTDRDIVVEAVAAGLDPRTLTAGEVMTPDPVTAREDDDISWALKIMRDRGVRRLPVIDKDGGLAGIIALEDLLESASGSLGDAVLAIGAGRVAESFRRPPVR